MKQSKVVNRCAHEGDCKEEVHMRDVAVHENACFLRGGVRQQGVCGVGVGVCVCGGGHEITKGLKGGEERWRHNG